MTQEQLKEQFLNYAVNNLNNQSVLDVMAQLLDNIGGELYSDGYTTEANKLWTAQDIIKEVLENEK